MILGHWNLSPWNLNVRDRYVLVQGEVISVVFVDIGVLLVHSERHEHVIIGDVKMNDVVGKSLRQSLLQSELCSIESEHMDPTILLRKH